MKYLSIILLIISVVLLAGCSEDVSEQKTILTPTPTVSPTHNEKIHTIKVDGYLDDWKSINVNPVLSEVSNHSVPDSANPQSVYLASDGDWVYLALKVFGEIEEERNYLLLLYNSQTKEVLRIKWDNVQHTFETEHLKNGRYVKNFETYGEKTSNTLEIVSRSYSVAKDCDVVKIIITKRGSVESEYEKTIEGSASDVIPILKINFELNTHAKPQETVTGMAWEIHREAWKMVVDRAKTDDYFRYAIYASRTLAVKHPEIYLQADKLFIQKISQNYGFKRAYEIKDVHSEYLYGKSMVGEPFSFDLVDFSKYKIIKSDEIYPEAYPVFEYIDRRLSPVASTLKTANNEITELEKIVQYYLAKNSEENYVIYCDNDRAYLWSDGKILDSNLNVVESVDGNPILIFNEKYVWYPLMGRDDTSKDKKLEEIVKKLSKSVKTPSLSSLESEVVEELKNVTSLRNEEKKMAILASIRAGPIYFKEEWREIIQSKYGNLWHSVLKEIIKDANYLSPISASLAAILKTNPKEDGLNAMVMEYLAHASTNGIEAHGHLWRCTLVEYTVEDSYRTKAGHCAVQAANLMAVLNLAGIENYRISAVDPYGHDWLYVPAFDVVLSNGRVEKKGSVMCEQRVIRMISYDDKWALVLPYDFYAGTLPPEQAIEILTYLKNKHNEEFYGGKKMGDEWERIPFDVLIKSIEEMKITWSPQVGILK